MTTPQECLDFETAQASTIDGMCTHQDDLCTENGKYQHLTYEAAGGTISVTEYVGALGVGYIIIMQVTVAGQLWQKATDHGAEGRSTDWMMITDAV